MTNAQLEIADYTPPPPEPTNQDRFMAFHALNPHILAAIITEALDMKYAREHERGSVKRIVENLRWNPSFRVLHDGKDFKINNTYAAFYARLAMETEPRLAGFFETREKSV